MAWAHLAVVGAGHARERGRFLDIGLRGYDE